MARQSMAKKYVGAAGFALLSLWVLYQIGSAVTNGFIYTLAVKHSAHLIVFRDNPSLLIGTLVFYVLIGPGLGAVYVYINFIAERRRPPPLAARTQRELLEAPYKLDESLPRRPGPESTEI